MFAECNLAAFVHEQSSGNGVPGEHNNAVYQGGFGAQSNGRDRRIADDVRYRRCKEFLLLFLKIKTALIESLGSSRVGTPNLHARRFDGRWPGEIGSAGPNGLSFRGGCEGVECNYARIVDRSGEELLLLARFGRLNRGSRLGGGLCLGFGRGLEIVSRCSGGGRYGEVFGRNARRHASDPSAAAATAVVIV